MANLEHRKANAKVQLLGKDGKALCNTEVSINQINHEFLFGCGAFESLAYANYNSDINTFTSIKGKSIDFSVIEDRMNKWLNLFNFGTLPFYWGGFEPEEGKPHTEELMKAAKFLQSKDVTVKGHTLCWQTVYAPWLLKYSDEEIYQKQLQRISREVGDFKGLVDMWDVINETVIMPIYDKYENPATRICNYKGRANLIKAVFNQAKEANPDGIFLINDFNLSEKYQAIIKEALDSKVPIHTIGVQSHQHHGVWGKEHVDEMLTRFEGFGLPIHFTENTIVAGPAVDPSIIDLQDAHYEDDAATPEYEEMQADELEKMYRNLFENHPLVTAITNWDFGDGAWLNAPSGVIRKDGSLKPSYNRLHKLIKEEWHTQVKTKTDSQGFVDFTGFKGKYEIAAKDRKSTFTLSSKQKEIKVEL